MPSPIDIPSNHFVTLDGIRFHYLDWGGEGDPDLTRHPTPIKAAHPKARANARNPLAGSKPFTTANELLFAAGRTPVDSSRLDPTPRDR